MMNSPSPDTEPRFTEPFPFVDVAGTAEECGYQLGHVWAEALRDQARRDARQLPWWNDKRYAPLVRRYAPHLPTLYAAMARGAGLESDRIAPLGPLAPAGCTSFGLQPTATLAGVPISGQTKDTPVSRLSRFQVLRLRMHDAPSMLTLTYPGWLFGHGFVEGGCAIWRNSLFTQNGAGLPPSIWGLLAMHCGDAREVAELTRREGLGTAGHMTVADAAGHVSGIESTDGGVAVLEPTDGIYVHANAVRGSDALRQSEHDTDTFTCEDSSNREARLREQLERDHARLTPQLLLAALADHVGYPSSICRHQSDEAMTTAVVIAEPTRGQLHVVRGQPCQNWPTTYAL